VGVALIAFAIEGPGKDDVFDVDGAVVTGGGCGGLDFGWDCISVGACGLTGLDVDVEDVTGGLGAILTRPEGFIEIPFILLEGCGGAGTGLGATAGVSTRVGYVKGAVGSSMKVEEVLIVPVT
jgi:hypothetical protein